MFLTVSKRLEFSASRRLFDPGLSSAAESDARSVTRATARYGAGRNYVAWFVFTGTVDPATGMLMNISEIKQRAGQVIEDGYDHKFLNEDNAAFAGRVPTAGERRAAARHRSGSAFSGSGAELFAVHLEETPQRAATAYANGVTESHHEFRFSAARTTMSPHLSEAENEQLFGIASSPFGHGHDYRARLTTRTAIDAASLAECIDSLVRELDHRNLNAEVPGLQGIPITTEMLSAYIFQRASSSLPMHRVRLHERSDFFAEFNVAGQHLLALQVPFSASHRLQSYEYSEAENAAMYGKCNNPRGHGHLYISEATIGGPLDERSGTLCNFTEFQRAMGESVRAWDNKHLDLETEEFRRRPSTGENIVQVLWEKTNPLIWNRLERLRLWETANNRFTLRRR